MPGATNMPRRMLVLMFFVIGIVPSSASTRRVFCPATAVSLTFSMERRDLHLGQNIIVNYRITNISAHSLFIPLEWSETCPSWPHVGAWLENRQGKSFVGGYAGDCSPEINSESVSERISKEAVLLKPSEHREGSITLRTRLLGGLRPGIYRIRVVVRGWMNKDFSQKQWSELAGMNAPLLTGQIAASASVRLL